MSDVKGWNPEYQSILETFDMINNKYENPDVSKDLNISHVGAWSNSTTSSLNTFGPFNWNTPLNPNFINTSTVNFEIYCNIYITNLMRLTHLIFYIFIIMKKEIE